MEIVLEQLIKNLTAGGLMSADEVTSLGLNLPSDDHPSDPESVVQGLITAGKQHEGTLAGLEIRQA